MPDSQSILIPMLIMFGITLLNIGILIGLLLNSMPGILTWHLILLAVVEFAAVMLAYQHTKSKSREAAY